MTSFEFEKLTKEALLEIPEHVRKKMDNVAVVIEKRSPYRSLLGLYQGVPKTAWGRAFGMRLPDKKFSSLLFFLPCVSFNVN